MIGLKVNDDFESPQQINKEYAEELVSNIVAKELADLKKSNIEISSQLADLNKRINDLYNINKSNILDFGTVKNNVSVLVAYFHTYRIVKQLSFWDKLKLLFSK